MTFQAQLLRLAAFAFLTLLLGGCIESSRPTVPADKGEDFGPRFDMRVAFPHDGSQRLPLAPPKTPYPYPGLHFTDLMLNRSSGASNSYRLTFRQIDDAGMHTIDMQDSLTARLRHMGKFGRHEMVLMDLQVTIEGTGHITSLWLVSQDSSAFVAYIRCTEANVIWMSSVLQSRERPKCNPLDKTAPLADFVSQQIEESKPGGLQTLMDTAIAEHRLTFIVNCEMFPEYASSIEGFQTSCMKWPPHAPG